MPSIVRYYILDTGYCLAWERSLYRGGHRRIVKCHSLAALLHHSVHGWILWDTGYAPRLLHVTRHLPNLLYRMATPMHIQPDLAVEAQLRIRGIAATDVRYVILSHFHADHIAGVRDFPTAQFITLQEAYDDVAHRHGLVALHRAFIPELLPDDFLIRARLIRSLDGPSVLPLGSTHDLFGDGSIRLVGLPGHARGQIGLFVQTEFGQVLFAADGCWHSVALRENRPPSMLTHLFVDDVPAMLSTHEHLREFAALHPQVTIIPSHCPEGLARADQQGVLFDSLQRWP